MYVATFYFFILKTFKLEMVAIVFIVKTSGFDKFGWKCSLNVGGHKHLKINDVPIQDFNDIYLDT